MRKLVNSLVLGTLLLVGICGLSGSAWAQTPVEKPSSVVWDHPDFATATSYTFGYFLLPVNADGTCNVSAPTAAEPVKTDTFAKPATTDGVGMSALLVAKPIGCYIAKMRALDVSGLLSEWSIPTGPFVFRPTAPVPRVVK